jgi:hypothetical protein
MERKSFNDKDGSRRAAYDRSFVLQKCIFITSDQTIASLPRHSSLFHHLHALPALRPQSFRSVLKDERVP